jgi:hypothetical protein
VVYRIKTIVCKDFEKEAILEAKFSISVKVSTIYCKQEHIFP